MTEIEIDRKMAEKVMGWTVAANVYDEGSSGLWLYNGKPSGETVVKKFADFKPSTNITHTLEVVGKMREKGFFLILNDTGCQYRCAFSSHENKAWEVFINKPPNDLYVWEATPQLAICLAALEAVK